MCRIPEGFTWSFSRISSFDQCPMSFKLTYLDEVDQQNNAFADYGTLCHSCLEHYMKGQTPVFALAEEFESRYDSEVTGAWPPFPVGLGGKYFDQGMAFFNSWDGIDEDKYEIVDSEKHFVIEVEGNIVVGVIDAVLRNKATGRLVVWDWKSKSYTQMKKDLKEYRNQLYIYAMGCHKLYGEYPESIAFYLFREDKMVEEQFGEEELEKTKHWIVDTIERIKSSSEYVVSPSGYFCKYICSVSDHCDAVDAIIAAELEKKRKKEEAEAADSRSMTDQLFDQVVPGWRESM